MIGAAWAEYTLVSWSRDGTAQLWTVEGALVATLSGSAVVGAAGGAAGRLVSWSRDGTARLWSRDGAPLATLDATAVVGAAWSADGAQLALWSHDGLGRLFTADGIPTVTLSTSGVRGGAWSGRGNGLITWFGATATVWDVRPPSRSLRFNFGDPSDQVQVTGRSSGPQPLMVQALAGPAVVGVATGPPGAPTQVTVGAAGTTSVVVTGDDVAVTRICRMELVREQIERTWICFAVARGPVAPLGPPTLTGRALPGFARNGGSEQVIGLTLEPRPSPPTPTQLFPLARTARDTVVYDVSRRADGSTPIGDATIGPWVDLPPSGTGTQARMLTRTSQRPAGHRSPSGWPDEPQDLIDDTLDPAVRFYSYRVRGRDLFGRQSDWSTPLSVDAADQIGPPPPAALTARHLDPADPWLDADDAAMLPAGGGDAVRLRWSWTRERAQQAPDATSFRVYWHGRPFTTATADLTAVTTDPAGYRLRAALRHPPATLPVDAFRGDWLRQGNRQWLVLASSAINPTTLLVSALDADPPGAGPAALTLRPPDPQRLDLLGNPLRTDPLWADPVSPLSWDERVFEGTIGRTGGAVVNDDSGVSITVQQVLADKPRDGAATVVLAPGWRWSGAFPAPWRLEAAGTTWPITGASLGATATLVVDAAAGPPPLASAVLRDTAGTVHTLRMNVNPPSTSFRIVGGTVWTGAATMGVLAHRAVSGGTELAVALPAGVSTPARLDWTPDHEFVLTGRSLPVSAAEPHATGTVGVSTIDGRGYVADRRGLPTEPTGPGNEGPVAHITIRRDYRDRPAAQPAPAGTTGLVDLWAPLPDEFSGVSRYPLRFTPAGVNRFDVLHATLGAVLDGDAADAAAARGAYAGQVAITGAALEAFKAQQAALGAQALQALATAQPMAFTLLTPTPLQASDPLLADPQTPSGLRFPAPLDGSAPGRHFLRVRAVDEAGNAGPLGPATLPISVPDGRRPDAPRLRRVIDGDRCVWLVWDVSSAGVMEYRVYRAQLPAGTRPDLRDMTLLATVPAGSCPEPTVVFASEAHFAGPAPQVLVAVYRAEDYDPTLAAGAQTATPVARATLTGTRVGELALADGQLVFVVVRPIAGATPVLATPATGRAYRDATALVGLPHQYCVEAVRQGAVDATAKVLVRSFASEIGEGTAFDAGPPTPPAATATWQPALSAVRIAWAATGLPAQLEVAVQRGDPLRDAWMAVGGFRPASTGFVDDAAVVSGFSYFYRLRSRNASGRTSEDERTIGPVTIP